jgi:hypothetical protein
MNLHLLNKDLPKGLSSTAALMLLALQENSGTHESIIDDDGALRRRIHCLRFVAYPPPMALAMNLMGPSATEMARARDELKAHGFYTSYVHEPERLAA